MLTSASAKREQQGLDLLCSLKWTIWEKMYEIMVSDIGQQAMQGPREGRQRKWTCCLLQLAAWRGFPSCNADRGTEIASELENRAENSGRPGWPEYWRGESATEGASSEDLHRVPLSLQQKFDQVHVCEETSQDTEATARKKPAEKLLSLHWPGNNSCSQQPECRNLVIEEAWVWVGREGITEKHMKTSVVIGVFIILIMVIVSLVNT